MEQLLGNTDNLRIWFHVRCTFSIESWQVEAGVCSKIGQNESVRWMRGCHLTMRGIYACNWGHWSWKSILEPRLRMLKNAMYPPTTSTHSTETIQAENWDDSYLVIAFNIWPHNCLEIGDCWSIIYLYVDQQENKDIQLSEGCPDWSQTHFPVTLNQ